MGYLLVTVRQRDGDGERSLSRWIGSVPTVGGNKPNTTCRTLLPLNKQLRYRKDITKAIGNCGRPILSVLCSGHGRVALFSPINLWDQSSKEQIHSNQRLIQSIQMTPTEEVFSTD